MKMDIAFGWFWPLLKLFLFEWRFADWPWNVVILLGFQVPVPSFDLIFGICDTCRCEITWTIISGWSLVFAFFREKRCVLFSVLRILPEWRWSNRTPRNTTTIFYRYPYVGKLVTCQQQFSQLHHVALKQGSGTYGSWARCGSFDDDIWLAWYFLNTTVTDITFSAIFLQSHQQHHAAPEVALTVRSMFLKRKFGHLPFFKIVDFA